MFDSLPYFVVLHIIGLRLEKYLSLQQQLHFNIICLLLFSAAVLNEREILKVGSINLTIFFTFFFTLLCKRERD